MASLGVREPTASSAPREIDYTHHYRKWHDDSEEHSEAMCRHFQTLLGPYLPESKDARILDVGCGMGFALLALREVGYNNLEGIDSDQGQVAAACNRSLDVIHVVDAVEYVRARPGYYGLVLWT